MRKTIRTALFCIAASALAFGAQDLKITYRIETKALMTSKGTQVEYHSEHYSLVKNDGEKKDVLTDYGKLVMYEIDHKKKVIRRMALDDLSRAMELMKARLSEGGHGAMVAGLMAEDADVTATKVGTEQIAGRTCEKWDVAMGKFSFKASVDPSLASPADQDALAKAKRLASGSMLSVLGEAFGKFLDATQSIKGFQLKSEQLIPAGPMTMRNFKEATEVVVGPVPASLFELPKGYKEEDVGKKMLEDMEKRSKK